MSSVLASDEDGPGAAACPYRIITLLGGGAVSVTYLAQTITGSPKYVALKIIHSCTDSSTIMSRFMRWKDLLRDIRHPGLAPLVDAGPLAPRGIYLASEYVSGSPL